MRAKNAKKQDRKFYEVIWYVYDQNAIPSVLHENFTFRGSLGLEKRGNAGFAEYVEMAHKVLGEYRCIIEKLVSEEIRRKGKRCLCN